MRTRPNAAAAQAEVLVYPHHKMFSFIHANPSAYDASLENLPGHGMVYRLLCTSMAQVQWDHGGNAGA